MKTQKKSKEPFKGKRLTEEIKAAIRAEPPGTPLRAIGKKYGVGLNTAARYRPRAGNAPATIATAALAPQKAEGDRIVLRAEAAWGTVEISLSKAGLLSSLLGS